MQFEWDPKKNLRNFEKHGIRFHEAALIFEGPVLSAEDQREDYGERRIISIGSVLGIAVVVVIHTDRSGRTRIISARKANRKERKRYYEYIKKKN